jgi:hypothetical protein
MISYQSFLIFLKLHKFGIPCIILILGDIIKIVFIYDHSMIFLCQFKFFNRLVCEYLLFVLATSSTFLSSVCFPHCIKIFFGHLVVKLGKPWVHLIVKTLHFICTNVLALNIHILFTLIKLTALWDFVEVYVWEVLSSFS